MDLYAVYIVFTVGGIPSRSLVLECRVISAKSSDAYPRVLTPAVTRRLLFSLSVQPSANSALQSSLVATPSPG